MLAITAYPSPLSSPSVRGLIQRQSYFSPHPNYAHTSNPASPPIIHNTKLTDAATPGSGLGRNMTIKPSAIPFNPTTPPTIKLSANSVSPKNVELGSGLGEKKEGQGRRRPSFKIDLPPRQFDPLPLQTAPLPATREGGTGSPGNRHCGTGQAPHPYAHPYQTPELGYLPSPTFKANTSGGTDSPSLYPSQFLNQTHGCRQPQTQVHGQGRKGHGHVSTPFPIPQKENSDFQMTPSVASHGECPSTVTSTSTSTPGTPTHRSTLQQQMQLHHLYQLQLQLQMQGLIPPQHQSSNRPVFRDPFLPHQNPISHHSSNQDRFSSSSPSFLNPNSAMRDNHQGQGQNDNTPSYLILRAPTNPLTELDPLHLHLQSSVQGEVCGLGYSLNKRVSTPWIRTRPHGAGHATDGETDGEVDDGAGDEGEDGDGDGEWLRPGEGEMEILASRIGTVHV